MRRRKEKKKKNESDLLHFKSSIYLKKKVPDTWHIRKLNKFLQWWWWLPLLFLTVFSMRLKSLFWIILSTVWDIHWAKVGVSWQELIVGRLNKDENGWNGKKWVDLKDTSELQSIKTIELHVGLRIFHEQQSQKSYNDMLIQYEIALFCFSAHPAPHLFLLWYRSAFFHNKETSRGKTKQKGKNKNPKKQKNRTKRGTRYRSINYLVKY